MAAADSFLRLARSVVTTGVAGKQVEVDIEPRCPGCGRMLGYVLARPWSVQCSRCKQRRSNP